MSISILLEEIFLQIEIQIELEDTEEYSKEIDRRIGRKDTTTIYNTPVQSRPDDTYKSGHLAGLDEPRTPSGGVGGGRGKMARGGNLLFDLEVLVGRVLVTVDLHVGYVPLLGSGGDGTGLFHLEKKDKGGSSKFG